ncbi:hypothetical protein BASA62_004611 [Batrachochytrium salamandrivorans]|nr:hypothetical protein BASA62_004611 [Batrachochytrium salamandrivorans]
MKGWPNSQVPTVSPGRRFPDLTAIGRGRRSRQKLLHEAASRSAPKHQPRDPKCPRAPPLLIGHPIAAPPPSAPQVAPHAPRKSIQLSRHHRLQQLTVQPAGPVTKADPLTPTKTRLPVQFAPKYLSPKGSVAQHPQTRQDRLWRPIGHTQIALAAPRMRDNQVGTTLAHKNPSQKRNRAFLDSNAVVPSSPAEGRESDYSKARYVDYGGTRLTPGPVQLGKKTRTSEFVGTTQYLDFPPRPRNQQTQLRPPCPTYKSLARAKAYGAESVGRSTSRPLPMATATWATAFSIDDDLSDAPVWAKRQLAFLDACFNGPQGQERRICPTWDWSINQHSPESPLLRCGRAQKIRLGSGQILCVPGASARAQTSITMPRPRVSHEASLRTQQDAGKVREVSILGTKDWATDDSAKSDLNSSCSSRCSHGLPRTYSQVRNWDTASGLAPRICTCCHKLQERGQRQPAVILRARRVHAH